MKRGTALAFAKTGVALHGAFLLGFAGCTRGLMATFDSLGEGADVAQNAGKITGGVADAVRALALSQSLALIGLVLLTIAIVGGKIRERWVLRWSRVCMALWIPMIGLGTIFGITGLVLLHKHRNEFKGDADKTAQPGATDNPDDAQ